jgi:5-amino-6-(5-phospho-D-ribitylamino)uracil phosphatase
MSNIKLVAIDLDGTLLTSNKTVSHQSIEAVKRCLDQGIYVVIATARSMGFVEPIYNQLNLRDPLICVTGGKVWEKPQGELWAYHTLPLSIAKAIITLADEHNWFLSTTVGDIRYWRKDLTFRVDVIPRDVKMVNSNIEALIDEPVRILARNPEAIEAIQNLCQTQFAGQCRTEIFYNSDGTAESLMVVAIGADKGSALQLVLSRLEIDPAQVLAIGDNGNDVPMFKVAGTAVAMANALNPIKLEANIIAPDNDHDGVAWALMNHVL